MTDWDKFIVPKSSIIETVQPVNQIWSGGALIFKEMNKAEFDNEYPSQPLASGVLTDYDVGSGDVTSLAIVENGKITEVYQGKEAEAKIAPWIAEQLAPETRVYNNLMPTHDPYTNPNSHIYYECSCGAILDPGTNRFASLNNAAEKAGWKIRFGPQHYVPYCVKCGENVE